MLWSGVSDARELTRPQWALLVLETVQVAVDNGGFVGLVDRPVELQADMLEAAHLVGAAEYLPVLREAVAALPEEDLERLSALDDRFYELSLEGTPLLEHALRFAYEHPQEVFLSDEEAKRDVDDLIVRLQARAGPVPVVDPGSGVPWLVARLYAEIGDGGWGPFDGMLSLLEAEEWAARLQIDAVPLWSAGAELICIETDDPALPVVRIDPAEPRPRYVAASLRGWLESWLAR